MAVEHVSGATEPWVQDVLCALLRALRRDKPTVLECGSFMGHTTARLAETLQEIGGGTLYVAEWDPEAPDRADVTQARLEALTIPDVKWEIIRSNALSVINGLPDESIDFCFLDDDHSHQHVAEELAAVGRKVKQGGIVCGHDVFGQCQLHQEFTAVGGYSLDFPALGPAGGLGIWQLR